MADSFMREAEELYVEFTKETAESMKYTKKDHAAEKRDIENKKDML